MQTTLLPAFPLQGSYTKKVIRNAHKDSLTSKASELFTTVKDWAEDTFEKNDKTYFHINHIFKNHR